MRGEGEDVSTQLRAAGWRQGSFLEQGALVQLGITGGDVAVVISQDCDVIQSVDIEPDIELMLGLRRDSPRGDCRYGRNPRELDLEVAGLGGVITVRIRDRILTSKEHLATHRPAAALAREDVALLARWIAKRYTRSAWPDAFNERLRPVDDRLERLFKSDVGIPITSILLMLDRHDEELPEGEPYRLAVWLTVAEESLMNDLATTRAFDFERRFKEILDDCEGIDLVKIEVRSEADVTMADLREFRRFDRDYRSVAPKPGGKLPPSEL